MSTDAGRGSTEAIEESEITRTVVDFLERSGVKTYSVKRSPSWITLTLPNEPESAVRRHARDIEARLSTSSHRDIKPFNVITVIETWDDGRTIRIDFDAPGDKGARDQIVGQLRDTESYLRGNGIDSLVLFGSVARNKPYPGDVDLLVRLKSDARLSAFDNVRVIHEGLRFTE